MYLVRDSLNTTRQEHLIKKPVKTITKMGRHRNHTNYLLMYQ